MTYNESLLGLDRPLAQLEQLIHQPIQGSDLQLTIDRRIQQAADQALGGVRHHRRAGRAQRSGVGDGQQTGF